MSPIFIYYFSKLTKFLYMLYTLILNYYIKLKFFDIIINFVFFVFRVKPYFSWLLSAKYYNSTIVF